MSQVITYSLRDGRKHSDEYFDVVADFTDEVIAEAHQRVGDLIVDFQAYIKEEGREVIQTTHNLVKV